jgi:hypothetical protein
MIAGNAVAPVRGAIPGLISNTVKRVVDSRYVFMNNKIKRRDSCR